LVFFVLATKLTTSANAIFLQAAAPLYLLLLGPWLLKEKIRRGELLFAAPIAVGLGLFFAGTEPAAATAPDPFRGNILGACSGVAWALTITGLRWLSRVTKDGSGSITTVAAGNLIAFLGCLPMALPVDQLGARDAAALVYLGAIQIGLAYFCLTRALRHVPAFEMSMLLVVEPVFNPVWTWLLHGERPSRLGLVGGALILAATSVLIRWQATVSPNSRARGGFRGDGVDSAGG